MHPVETYLRDLHAIRGSGAAVAETSAYGPLGTLLTTIGQTLKPRVRCVMGLKNQGAGLPDGGLFTPEQFARVADAQPLPAQLPSRGVIEVKGTAADLLATAQGEQVARYLAHYGLVLVTNYRDFVLVGTGTQGQSVLLERYALAPSEAAFWATPVADLVAHHGVRLAEYLARVLQTNAPLAAPRDLAFFLASYARDARVRIAGAELPALVAVRHALEESLGIRFDGEKGEHFFRSTLIQTLFYGVFSAWVLWSKEHPAPADRFDWKSAAYYLHVPMIEGLFGQVAQPNRLRPLGLIEVLDWAGAALNRVDRPAFFAQFALHQAVQYFYEPFLEAFDPELRKQLGVWYTPPEIVRYQVARVDAALKTELGIADGLADERVHVLDPCCGTGAYLVGVLDHIAATLRAQGGDALLGEDLKQAALTRIWGFELLPAPFVVAHLQLGLLLQQFGAPLADSDERAGVFLTNALTGWEPPDAAKEQLVQQQLVGMPELREERDLARQVKREAPILVILGNPPYSGFAGIAQIDEERDLSTAYRTTKAAPAPQGQGLNDLYVRFFRMAERRIVGSGQGIVCFISNYSWLDGLSFTGMRERYLEAFDTITIDSLNGDKYKTGKVTPEGTPDPSVFSTPFNPEGIQVGTAIALLVRRGAREAAPTIRFRHLWGKAKREELLMSLNQPDSAPYQLLAPPVQLGFPLMPSSVAADYLAWPKLPEVFPVFSPGVSTSRDAVLIDIDRERLVQRMGQYFDPAISHAELRRIAPGFMEGSAQFDAESTRDYLRKRGLRPTNIVRYAYQPFDTRWLYWEAETKLLDRNREELFDLFKAGNAFLISRQKAERQNEGTPFYVTQQLPDRHLTRPGSICFPMMQNGTASAQQQLFEAPADAHHPKANLSATARAYLTSLDVHDPDATEQGATLLWMHALAIGFSPAYLAENAGGLRQDWPRVPLPRSRERLQASADLGRLLAALLDPEQMVAGVTSGTVRPELRTIGGISRVGGGQLTADDLALTANWGYGGRGGITMPGQGKAVLRPYSAAELASLAEGATALGLSVAQALALLGEETYDVQLNGNAYWQNMPANVWGYTIGGYQVIKKWLSYREQPLLGRALSVAEAREVRDMARRIAAILLLAPALDASYGAVK